jgi:C1A family cysteine protease
MASVDLRSKFGPIEQQGAPNSCVAHAATSVVEAVLGVADLSRLFVYYNARVYANQAGGDFGCQPRNAVKGIAQFGAPSEMFWPYSTAVLTMKPDMNAYATAQPLRSRIKSYQSITSLAAMKSSLDLGLPVMFALMVPDTFVSRTKYDGFLPMWNTSNKWLGGHAVVACGYDVFTPNTILCRNSFGSTWGREGYFEMPYAWFPNFYGKATDAWTFVPA